MTARRLTIAALVVLVAYLATGLVAIPQDEVGVVRRFGAVLREPWTPGLHWGLPWGIDRVDRLALERSRTISVGDPADFLTGDLNLVSASAHVQFRVSETSAYLFSTRSADASLSALGESALSRTLAVRGVDDVLTSGRNEVADRMRRKIQEGADALGLGVSVISVRIDSIAPPVQVAPAFADAARARSDQRQAVTLAETYRDRSLLDTRNLARETAHLAVARSDAIVQSSRGEAERFTRLLRAASKNPVAARRTMYLDALAELLPRFARKVVVAPGQDVDLSVTTD